MVERENYNRKIELFFKSQEMISNPKIEPYEIIRARYVKKVERKLLMVSKAPDIIKVQLDEDTTEDA